MAKKDYTMESFFTRPAGDKGTRLPLFDPVTGDDTEHWIEILSIDSTVYEQADTVNRRRMLGIKDIEDEKERADFVNELTRDLIASLVVAWSFPKPCTHEEVVAFLKIAPQIQRAINHASGQRANFFESSSKSSETTDESPSSSTESSPEAQQPDAST